MSEKVDWLQVVIDYGKRNPNATIGDLFGDITFNYFFTNVKFCELVLFNGGLKQNNNYFYFLIDENALEYYNSNKHSQNGWTKVPINICLRLLTEGKEDLI